jgi:hypothetical protein
VSPQETACRLVFEDAVQEGHPTFALDEVKIVWFAYVLGNWKAIVITTLPDECLYEVTHNAAKGETYLDKYLKTKNVVHRASAGPAE